ncbi:hypothetical protein AN963_18310 [Brevibacillus choshinensis]|uniref:Uracil-DNA glycosylase-like domain-containing protein n=1 Tax=Brevibacillus choshinensis TaxID=54911 RepID=A0ABR5N898_BRECH|nr:hypothetical protein [Brevibacillus choshinensis]KQL46849.1 hypothetical protein AN963_18310 [Brevibacillus choshinensis]
MLITTHLPQYKQAILSLPKDRMLTKADLLVDDFLMDSDGKLRTYYAPHNEYVNRSAKVIILGITPGWNQMKIAMQEARRCLEAGLPDEEVCQNAKQAASFVGSMRTNLVAFLDALDLHQHLGVTSCEDLFYERRSLLHTTSLLRYPVFVEQQNYNGSDPHLVATPFLTNAVMGFVQEELPAWKQTLLIPLGKGVESVLQLLEGEGKLDALQCLWGFPHPSGANGHRHKQFAAHQARMKVAIQNYFG